jgi:hypothetical protein
MRAGCGMWLGETKSLMIAGKTPFSGAKVGGHFISATSPH